MFIELTNTMYEKSIINTNAIKKIVQATNSPGCLIHFEDKDVFVAKESYNQLLNMVIENSESKKKEMIEKTKV